MNPLNQTTNKSLTYIYVSNKLSKKIDKYGGEEGPSLLAQKLLHKYNLTEIEGLYNDIKQITEDETALKKIMWIETGLFMLTTSFSEGLLLSKKILIDSEKITKLCKEGKFEEALQKTLEIPPEYQAAKEKTLKNFALAFINREDFKNASLAISHLPEGNEKNALKLKCDGNYTEPKKTKQPLTLKHVLEAFHKVVPYGIGSHHQKILVDKNQSLLEEWSPIYSLDECKKLVKEAELAEQNGEDDPLLSMALALARGLTVTVVAETLMEEGKYVESMKVISEIHYPQEETQMIAKAILEDCKNCGDMQSAAVILTYIPEGEEKNQIAKELGFSQVINTMKPLLVDSNSITIEDIDFDLEQLKKSEIGIKMQERANKFLELDLATLKSRLEASQKKLAQYTEEKERVLRTSPNNTYLVKATLDKYFFEQEEIVLIQDAITRKENAKSEEEDEIKMPTSEFSEISLEEEKTESPKTEKKRSESPPPKILRKKKDNCIIS